MRMADLESHITGRQQEAASMQERFGDPAVYRDAAVIMRLRAEFDELSADLSVAEEVWLERMERLDGGG